MDAHVGTGAGGGAEGLGGSGARVQQRHMVSVPNWQLPPLVAPEGQPPPGPHTLPGMRTSPGPHSSDIGPSMAAVEKPMDAHVGTGACWQVILLAARLKQVSAGPGLAQSMHADMEHV